MLVLLWLLLWISAEINRHYLPGEEGPLLFTQSPQPLSQTIPSNLHCFGFCLMVSGPEGVLLVRIQTQWARLQPHCLGPHRGWEWGERRLGGQPKTHRSQSLFRLCFPGAWTWCAWFLDLHHWFIWWLLFLFLFSFYLTYFLPQVIASGRESIWALSVLPFTGSCEGRKILWNMTTVTLGPHSAVHSAGANATESPVLAGSDAPSHLILTILQEVLGIESGCIWLEATEYPNKIGSLNKKICNTFINNLAGRHLSLPKCSAIKLSGFEYYPVRCQ